MEISGLGCRVSWGITFLRVRFVTVAITQETAVKLKRWQLEAKSLTEEASPGSTQVQLGQASDCRPDFYALEGYGWRQLARIGLWNW